VRNQSGWVTKLISPDSKEINFIYDSSGNILKKIENISSGVTATTEYEYDSFNRLKKVKSANNEITIYTFCPVRWDVPLPLWSNWASYFQKKYHHKVPNSWNYLVSSKINDLA
jgi:hypothetical protein